MNERIVIRFTQNGQQLPVTSLTSDGVILGSETANWPSGLGIEFDADNPITEYRMRRIRQINGWDQGQYKLNMHAESGNLVLTGVKSDTLPSGSYWLLLRIADYIIPDKRYRAKLEEGGEAQVDIEIKNDPRRVELAGDLSTFDAEILRVLNNSESRLDGSTIPDWLQSPIPRARRKACLLNLLAKLRSAPAATTPLITDVRFVFFADVDRIYAAVDLNYYDRLVALAADPKKPFYAEGSPVDPGHKRLLERIKAFSGAQAYQLKSFRQEGKNSFQSVLAIPAGESSDSATCYADMDIDLGNPLQDVEGFFIHMGELVDPGTTDHLSLYSKLVKDSKLKPYLYYKVTKS